MMLMKVTALRQNMNLILILLQISIASTARQLSDALFKSPASNPGANPTSDFTITMPALLY
jgi:hypothetical protein